MSKSVKSKKLKVLQNILLIALNLKFLDVSVISCNAKLPDDTDSQPVTTD